MRLTTAARNAVLSVPGARAITDTPRAQELIQASRAVRVLAPASRFVRHSARKGTVGAYRVKTTGHPVHVRHRTRDVGILGEIFVAETYAPPAGLELPARPAILDLGGNIGLFALYALQRWQPSRVTSYEPDPANLELLHMNAAPHPAWDVVAAAVGAEEGELSFLTGAYSESRATRPGEAGVTVPMVDVYKAAQADLVKIDIEGGEWPILEDSRLTDLAGHAVVLEWHTAGCPRPDAPEHASSLLADAGYRRQVHMPRRFDADGLLWAWKG
jgi:FkbM family methyltransferase